MDDIIRALVLFLPAGIANMTPVLVSRLPLLKNWNTPIDFGRKHSNRRILGDNKTWRGVVFGSLLGGISGFVLYQIHPAFVGFLRSPSLLPGLDFFVAGLLLGFGALVGDAVESYFKRKKSIPSGESWFPFDQADYIIGGLIYSLPLLAFSPLEVLAIFGIYFGLHLIVRYFGYLLKINDKPI